MDQGIQHIWNQNKGKTVSVPVFVSAWASKAGNAGFDLYLSGDGKPVPCSLPRLSLWLLLLRRALPWFLTVASSATAAAAR